MQYFVMLVTAKSLLRASRTRPCNHSKTDKLSGLLVLYAMRAMNWRLKTYARLYYPASAPGSNLRQVTFESVSNERYLRIVPHPRLDGRACIGVKRPRRDTRMCVDPCYISHLVAFSFLNVRRHTNTRPTLRTRATPQSQAVENASRTCLAP